MKKKKNTPQKSMKYLALITQVGLSMITPILIGVFLGNWLDKKFKTSGVFFIVFLLIGVGGAFHNLLKLGQIRRDKHDE